jgi:hypothetical protein
MKCYMLEVVLSINVACWLLGSNGARTRAKEVEKAFLIAGAGAPVH